jgi:hypothetical protein
VSFAAITLCVTSQRVFIVVVYFVIDSVRKLLDTPSYSKDRIFLFRNDRTILYDADGRQCTLELLKNSVKDRKVN